MEGEIMMILFSWNLDFYEHLKGDQQDENEVMLKQALSTEWRKKFENKSQIFFYFLIDWISYIKKKLIVNKVSWMNIPGY